MVLTVNAICYGRIIRMRLAQQAAHLSACDMEPVFAALFTAIDINVAIRVLGVGCWHTIASGSRVVRVS